MVSTPQWPHLWGGVSLLIWLYLLLARGGFWRVSANLPPAPTTPTTPAAGSRSVKNVVAVIPARNEVDVIGDAVRSVLLQRFAGTLRVIVIDDGSADGTAQAALAAAAAIGAADRLTLIPGAPLPAGWSGKVWAMSQGAAAAAPLEPDFLLFTDADIHHEPGNVAALIDWAETQGRDLVSYMVRLSVATAAERWLIPAFVFFFLMLYPPRWVASARANTAAAAGGCMLMRPQALARIGGLQAIRGRLIDDCALACATKAAGGSVGLRLTRTARSLRPYTSFAEVGRMISRTAFNQLRHSYLLLAGTLLGLAVTYALPPLLLACGDPLSRLLGAVGWLLMSLAYAPMVRFYGLSLHWSLGLPAIAVFYGGATLNSALQFTLRRGGSWKGRLQDLGH